MKKSVKNFEIYRKEEAHFYYIEKKMYHLKILLETVLNITYKKLA